MDYIFDIQEILIVDLGLDIIFSCDNGFIIFIFQINGDVFLWLDGFIDISLIVIEFGIYSLIVIVDCGMVSDIIEVEELIDIVIVNINGLNIFCIGDIVIFVVMVNILGILFWFIGDIMVMIQVVIGGFYIVLFIDFCGWQVMDILMLNVLDVLFIFFQAFDVFCFDEIVGVSVFLEGVIGYIWLNGSVGDSVMLIGGGIYYIIVINGCGEFDIVFFVDSLIFFILEI